MEPSPWRIRCRAWIPRVVRIFGMYGLHVLSATLICDCSAQLQGVPGPPGPKCRKSLKKVVPGPSGQSAKKVPKKCRKSHEEVPKRDFFVTFSTFSALFWHSGPTGPGRPFCDFFRILGPEGLALPVTGRYNRKP